MFLLTVSIVAIAQQTSIEGIYANEYGEVQLSIKNDSTIRTIFKNNEGAIFDTLMIIKNDFKLSSNQNHLPFLQLHWGGLELHNNRLYVREYSNLLFLASYIQIQEMYTRAFYKIDKSTTIKGEVKFTKGGAILNGIYLIDYNKTPSKHIAVTGIITKETYPIDYYSTEASPQGMFGDTSIIYYRLVLKDYKINDLSKQIFTGTTINVNNQAAFAWEFADSEIYFLEQSKVWSKTQLYKEITIEAILIHDSVGKSILTNWEIIK